MTYVVDLKSQVCKIVARLRSTEIWNDGCCFRLKERMPALVIKKMHYVDGLSKEVENCQGFDPEGLLLPVAAYMGGHPRVQKMRRVRQRKI